MNNYTSNQQEYQNNLPSKELLEEEMKLQVTNDLRFFRMIDENRNSATETINEATKLLHIENAELLRIKLDVTYTKDEFNQRTWICKRKIAYLKMIIDNELKNQVLYNEDYIVPPGVEMYISGGIKHFKY